MDATPTVYVVDDDESVAMATSRLLEGAGHHVEAYTSPVVFLERAALAAPCCVLLDLEMPERTGFDVQAALSRRRPAPPVVFLTAHASVRRSVAAMRAGAADFLEKPVEREELLAAVGLALRESAQRSAAHEAAEEARRRVERLTPRERQVCDLVAEGRLNREISVQLGAAVKTIKVHRARVKDKLGVGSVAELVELLQRARGDA